MWLTGWDFGTYNNFHRWVARIATLQAVIHSVAYTILILRRKKTSQAYHVTDANVAQKVDGIILYHIGLSFGGGQANWYATRQLFPSGANLSLTGHHIHVCFVCLLGVLATQKRIRAIPGATYRPIYFDSCHHAWVSSSSRAGRASF